MVALSAIATNLPLPNAISNQLDSDESVLAGNVVTVQVTPSVDHATLLLKLPSTITNLPLPNAIALAPVAALPTLQVRPPSDDTALEVVPESLSLIATNFALP